MSEARVTHMPNIPGPVFTIEGLDLETATIVSDALAYYDLFLLEHGFREDFANISAVQQQDEDGWFDVDEEDLEEYRLDHGSVGSE